ncbi:MAG: DUF2249 domain-containing protein [Gemmatimonadota bacterium]
METAVKPTELQGVDGSRFLDLDVRSDLRAGREPFDRIMHARQALAQDGILRLRTLFQPRPLYAVMAREGFQHWTEKLGEEDFRVWFYRSEAAEGSSLAEDAHGGRASEVGGKAGKRLPNCGSPRPEPGDIHVLDVRGLEPPEPMVRTLEFLEGMEEDHTLVQLNSRVPRFLLPELEGRGFQYAVRQEEDGLVRVIIRRAEALPVLDVRVLPPRDKHPVIFETFDALEPGEAFVLLNDHDPLPLRYQFQGERPGVFEWIYLEEGPELWRVEIRRTGPGAVESGPAAPEPEAPSPRS